MGNVLETVLFGALAAAAAPMALTIGAAATVIPDVVSGDRDLWQAVHLAVFLMFVALPMVLITSFVVGLPPTAWLEPCGAM